MNSDVLIWGPIGKLYVLGKKGQPQMRQQRWRDLPDEELADAINWVISQHGPVFNEMGKVRIHIYTNTKYWPLGTTIKVGKNLAGGGSLFHYMIVSDEPIESEEQALRIVDEALEPPEEVTNEGSGHDHQG